MWPAFDELYSDRGRRSIPPEQLLKALLLQILFTIRSERQMYRWFVGLHTDSQVWDARVYSKNRERLRNGDIARKFFNGETSPAAPVSSNGRHGRGKPAADLPRNLVEHELPESELPCPECGGSREGGRNAAILWRLMATCKTYDVNPKKYMTDVLTRLSAKGTDAADLDQLLPGNWTPIAV